MNHETQVEALLGLVDPERARDDQAAEALVVLGLAERCRKRGYRPTTAGWTVLGPKAAAYRGY